LPERFRWAQNGAATPLVVGADDWQGVIRAAGDLAGERFQTPTWYEDGTIYANTPQVQFRRSIPLDDVASEHVGNVGDSIGSAADVWRCVGPGSDRQELPRYSRF
jgi:hypothetical protein